MQTETEVLTNRLIHLGKRTAKDIASTVNKAISSSNWESVEKELAESIWRERGEVICAKIVKPNGKVFMADDESFCGDTVEQALLVKQQTIFPNHFFPEQRDIG